jgi:N-acetylmuramoyl-L-alanine amidase
VFYNSEYDTHKAFAEYLQAESNGVYEKQGVKHRKVSKGDLYMLQCTQAPSALVECGFLSNALDEELLVSGAWQEKIAGAIASGVLRFLSESAT